MKGFHQTGGAGGASQRGRHLSCLEGCIRFIFAESGAGIIGRRKSLSKGETITGSVRVSALIGGVRVKETSGRHQRPVGGYRVGWE